jgi:translation initiation factor SUI1
MTDIFDSSRLQLPSEHEQWIKLQCDGSRLLAAADGGYERDIHIRVQKRSAKKSITTVEGLNRDHAEHILKRLRKQLCCNGTLITTNENTPASGTSGDVIIQFSGDQREAVKAYLLQKKLCSESRIKVHGY